MIRKIYDNEQWDPGINFWWESWEIGIKRIRFTQSNYSRLINFKRVMGEDKDIIRHRIHMQNDFLMKKSFTFIRLHGLSNLFPDHHYKYCEKPLRKAQPLILAKVKPSLSSLCNIPIIYGYSHLLLDD